MTSALITDLVIRLIRQNLPANEDKQQKLANYYLRLLATNFSEEFENGKNMELKLGQKANKNKDRVLTLFTNFMNKKSVIEKQNVVKFLLKVAENNSESNESTNFLSNFSSRNTRILTDNTRIIRPNEQSTIFGHSDTRINDLEISKQDEGKLSTKLYNCMISTFQGFQSEMFIFDQKLEMFILRPKGEELQTWTGMRLITRLNEIGWLFLRIEQLKSNLKRKISGLTIQSFLSAVERELTEYYDFLVRMNNLGRTLKKGSVNFLTTVLVFVDEQFNKLRTLGILLENAYNLTSSELLSMLYIVGQSRFMAKDVYLARLFESACRILMEFINNWVLRGEIVDPMGEFFVKINVGVLDSDRYWSEGLLFIEHKIPTFMDNQTARLVFTGGKIIRLLKKLSLGNSQTAMRSIELKEIINGDNDTGIKSRLNDIYENHNRELMGYIKHQQQLKTVLVFLKDVYLTNRGDFCMQFIEELEKTIGLKMLPTAMKHNVKDCLENAVKIGFGNSILPVNDLEIEFVEKNLGLVNLSTEDVFEFFVNFSLKITGLSMPTNNILNSENLRKYQTIFRYLFTFKMARFQLSKFWRLLSKTKNEKFEQIIGLSRRCASVLNKMTKFVDGLLSFWIYDIIEKNWQKMIVETDVCNDFGKLIESQRIFLDKVIEELTFKFSSKMSDFETKQKSLYDHSLHCILKLIQGLIDCEDTIFLKIRKNLGVVEQNSYDSLELLENRNLEKFMSMNDKHVMITHTKIKKTEDEFCKKAVVLIELLKNKGTVNKLDFNGWYASLKANSNGF